MDGVERALQPATTTEPCCSRSNGETVWLGGVAAPAREGLSSMEEILQAGEGGLPTGAQLQVGSGMQVLDKEG